MSVIHYIIPEESYNLNSFFDLVCKIEDVKYDQRGSNIYYFWTENRSTRGMDFCIEGDRIEIRNTSFSNEGDYFVTNILVKLFKQVYKCKIVDSDGQQVNNELLFTDEMATKQIFNDYSVIKSMHEIEEGVIGLQGPYRTAHIGKKVFRSLNELNDSNAIKKLEELILDINYGYKEYEYGNVLEVKGNDNPEESKIIKMLTNKMDYFIDKYDYLGIHDNTDENPIVFTNEDLNLNLPTTWKLLDDYNIVAPALPKEEWQILVEKLSRFDIYNEIFQ